MEYNMDREQLKKAVQEFLQTQDSTSKDEWYATDFTVAEYVLNEFMKFQFPSALEQEIEVLENQLAKLKSQL